MDSQPLERCDNCLKDFPQSKMATHFGYCRRNIKKCPICQEMFDINFKEEHEEEYHRKDKCPHCSKEFPSADYKEHEKKCDLKPKFCEYCDLNVPVAGFSTHFKACESRTKPCSKCNKPIMNKDYLIHFVSCEGIVEPPKQPSNYQEHILQQQKKREELYSNPIDRVASRQKAVVRPKEERNYVGIVNNNKISENRVVYEPRIINQPRQQLEKKDAIRYPTRPEPKREEVVNPPKRITNNNLFPPSNQPKKEQSRSIGLKPPIAFSNEQKRTNPSREAIKPQGSYKDVYPTEGIKQPSVKDSKSIERNGSIRREEQVKGNRYTNQNINPKVEQPKKPSYEYKDYKGRIPPTKPKEEIARKKSPQARTEQAPQQFADFGISPEEQMLQEILMQSANEHKTKDKNRVNPASKPSYKSNEVPYMEGEDFMTESFIQKQRAIEQQLSRQRKGKR